MERALSKVYVCSTTGNHNYTSIRIAGRLFEDSDKDVWQVVSDVLGSIEELSEEALP
jgi:hypothetical protein